MIRTAECVTPRHPDKICDRISDAILDACLDEDEMSHVAIETMGGHGVINVTGELTTSGYVNIAKIAKGIVEEENYGVMVNVVEQSPAINRGVSSGGAGDQGIMVGYACNENEAMIPDELFYARKICMYLYVDCGFNVDGKTQVTMEDGKIKSVVASFQKVRSEELKRKVNDFLRSIDNVAGPDVVVHANPAGDWVLGGFDADTGLTGRKIAVDNYGPRVPIGGGAFSGKDSSKVDRSGAYAARKAAVELLYSTPQSKEVFVYLAYGIGLVYPLMATAHITLSNGEKKELELDPSKFTPNRIIENLKLRDPNFSRTARWGHMGRGFPWDVPGSKLFT